MLKQLVEKQELLNQRRSELLFCLSCFEAVPYTCDNRYYKAKAAKKALALHKKAAAGVNDIAYKKKYYNEASKQYLKKFGRRRGINIYKKTGYNHEKKFIHTSAHHKNAGLKALVRNCELKRIRL